VCVSGYLIIGLALVLFVQAKNVYPQLLLTRLFFSLGGAAAATMVTAVLPAVAAGPEKHIIDLRTESVTQVTSGNGHAPSPSIESEMTITPARFVSQDSRAKDSNTRSPTESDVASSTSRVAGFVGMFTGCGALIALTVFLPLPAKFQYSGIGEKAALKHSFYVVAAVAFVLAFWCFLGLRGLQRDFNKDSSGTSEPPTKDYVQRIAGPVRQMLHSFQTAILAGFQRTEIGLGYLGGFVARASSVGISLFIPLLVNAMFLSSGLCDDSDSSDIPVGLPDIKRKCPRAYIVAAEMTGVTETVALMFAPVFGYWMARASRKEVPLLAASVAGVIGYPLFANQFNPDGKDTSKRVTAFLAVALIGISQIGAIVCSLGTLSKGVLLGRPDSSQLTNGATNQTGVQEGENERLLPSRQESMKKIPLSDLKGAVAGVYSLYGGGAILILTKLGGLMFDKVTPAAPFYIMAVFNAMLTVACAVLILWRIRNDGSRQPSLSLNSD
jgi:hypothetical protein